MAPPSTIAMPADNTALEIAKFKMQLRNWNISASRLPPQSGYEELPAVSNAGVDVDAFPAGLGRLMTGTQVSALLLVWSPNGFAASSMLQLTRLGRPQITPHLDPHAMYQLARLCKPMRTALMKKANRHVWKAMFRKHPTFPPCPTHLIEPHYDTLLCGNECNACGDICPTLSEDIEPSVVAMTAKIGWLLCDVCLQYNLIPEEKLLNRYSAALPDRPEGSRLPKRIPLYDMRRFLPHHPLTCFFEEHEDVVPTNYYYRPEVDVFLREYLRRMESQEVFHDPHLETAWNIMADTRAAHVTLVNEFSDSLVKCLEVEKGPDSYTLRRAILERGDLVEAHGFELLEDLQRRPCKHDKFFDRPLTSEEVWTDAFPHIGEALNHHRSARFHDKARDFMEHAILYFEELVAEMPLSEQQRKQLPNHAHMGSSPCLIQLRIQHDDGLLAREEFLTVVPALNNTIRDYMEKLPGVFLAPLVQLFVQHVLTPRSIVVPQELDTEAKRSARLLGYAASMFACVPGWAPPEKDPIVLPFPEIHEYWRTNHPLSLWDSYGAVDTLGRRQLVQTPGVLRAMVPYAPSLQFIRCLGLPDDISLAEMDRLVRSERVHCSCKLTMVTPYRGAWGWAQLLAHCEYEHSQWVKIWGRPGAAAAHPPWTLKWSDDHTPSEAGLFRYREDQSTPGEYRLDLSSMVRTIEEILHAKPGREILACKVCCDLIGPGQDRMYIDAYRRTHNPADRTTRGPVSMALHLCKRHSIWEVHEEHLVLSQ
ncbi:hypothetical protein VTO73DRAFT_4159 [Trametes versicolor]